MSLHKEEISKFEMLLGATRIALALTQPYVEMQADLVELDIAAVQHEQAVSAAMELQAEVQAMAKYESTEMVTLTHGAVWGEAQPPTYETVVLENLEAEHKSLEELGDILDGADHIADLLESMDEEPAKGEAAEPEKAEAERPEADTSIAIGGPGVEAEVAEIMALQATHEQQLNDLHQARDKELAARAQKDAAWAEKLSESGNLSPEGVKTLAEAQEANQQMITNRYETAEGNLRQQQATEMGDLQAKQVAQQHPDAPPPPTPPPPPPPPRRLLHLPRLRHLPPLRRAASEPPDAPPPPSHTQARRDHRPATALPGRTGH
jgi:hypothetical protein